jgi:hypothetical protein
MGDVSVYIDERLDRRPANFLEQHHVLSSGQDSSKMLSQLD